MAGHSKWANIKHKKAKVDAQKGVMFAKFSREITVAAKLGGVDPTSNFRLRTAIDKAKSAGLPNDNIKRAIDKANGSGSNQNIEELTYEGYGPGGVAIFIEAMTDNRNRTAGDIRSYLNKFQGNLGENGCVSWIFSQQGEISLSKEYDYDALLETSISLEVKDFLEEDYYKLITEYSDLQKIAEALEDNDYKYIKAEVSRVPQNYVEITDIEIAKSLFRLLSLLEEHDDVQEVYSNFDISDEMMEQASI